MLLPLKPICPANKVRRDGTAPVFLQYCYSATNRTLLNTGITIPPQYWNTKQLCISEKLPANYGNHESLNDGTHQAQKSSRRFSYACYQKAVT